MSQHLHTFVGLSGVKRGRLRGVMAESVTGFMKALTSFRICTAAGDHGAATVYRDDAGNWRCCFHVWREPREEQCFKTKAEVREWLKLWLPVMKGAPAPSQSGEEDAA